MKLIVDERQERIKKNRLKVARKRNSTVIQAVAETRRRSGIQEDIDLGNSTGGL